jgi:hypothetical protein
MDIMSGNTNGIGSWVMHVADFTVHGSAAYALRIIHFAWTRWRRYSIGRKGSLRNCFGESKEVSPRIQDSLCLILLELRGLGTGGHAQGTLQTS